MDGDLFVLWALNPRGSIPLILCLRMGSNVDSEARRLNEVV